MASQVVLVKINLSNDLARILHMNFIFIAGGGYFRTQQSFCKLQGIGPSSLRDAHAEGAIGKTQFPQSSESIAFHLPSSSISFSYYDQSSSLPPSTYNLLPFPCRSMSKEYKNFLGGLFLFNWSSQYQKSIIWDVLGFAPFVTLLNIFFQYCSPLSALLLTHSGGSQEADFRHTRLF